jgi:dephospho-CoA kinase
MTDTAQFVLLSLEGNIGSGKSTVLQILKETFPEWIFVDEPVQ